jgi:DNA polymerase III delta prime subunit
MTDRLTRPIAGNAEIIRFLLRLAKSPALGHAYLFCGPEGVGKKLVSLEFARAVNCSCENAGGECESCRLMRSLSHPELLVLEDLNKPRWVSRREILGDEGDGDSNGSYGDVIQRAFESGYIEEPLPQVERRMAVDGFNLATDRLFGQGSVPSKECYTPGPVSEEIRKACDRGDIGEVDYRLLKRLYEYPLSVMPYRGAIPMAYVAERKGWKFIRPIQPFLSVRLMLEGRKIVIIDDAHKMTAEAQNCLLKTLEEPPADSLLILVTSDRQALFQTIVSRCQVVNFGRLAKVEMDALVDGLVGHPDDDVRLVASLSENCPGRFLDLSMYGMARRLDGLKGFFTGIGEGRLAGALRLSSSIMEESGSHRRQQRKAVTEALELAGFWLAQVLRAKAGLEDTLGLPGYSDAIKAQADAFDRAGLFKATERIEDALAVVRFNVDMRLLLDTTLLDIATLLHPM